MKLILKILFSIIIIILVVAIVGAVAIGIMVTDKTTFDNTKEENQNQEVVTNTILEKAFDKTNEDGKIPVKLNINQLNFLFYSLSKDLNSIDKFKINSTNVSVENNEYFLQASFEYQLIKSVAKIKLDFSSNSNNDLIIKLNKADLGNLSLSNGLVRTLVINNYKKDIEKEIKKADIDCTIDLDKFTITFTRDNLKNILLKNADSEKKSLFNLFFSIINEEDGMFNYNLGTDELLGFVLDIQKTQYSLAKHGELSYNYTFNSTDINDLTPETNIEKLYANKIISIDQVNVCYSYLINGYSSLSDSDKKTIDEIDLSSIKITNDSSVALSDSSYIYKKDYTGLLNKNNQDLIDLLGDISLQPNGLNSYDVDISDSDITKALNNLNFIGYSQAYIDPETNNLSYFTIEQMDVFCKDNALTLNLVVNIHGFQVILQANLVCDPQNGYKLIAKINPNSVSLGEIVLNESQQNDLLEYLSDVMTKSWMSVDKDNKTITFDFEKVLGSNASIVLAIRNLSLLGKVNITTSCIDGYVKINYSL